MGARDLAAAQLAMQEQLNRLIEKHCASIRASVAKLGEILGHIAKGANLDPLAALQEAEALAHQLKGSCGTAGFLEISEAATALDDHLKAMCKTPAHSVNQGMRDALRLFEALSVATASIHPGASRLYNLAPNARPTSARR